jgi:hypothetical protein
MVGVPVMACLQPEAAMTAQEKECCKKMAGQCGEMDNSSSHSCCTKVVQRSSPALVSVGAALTLDLSLFVILPSEQFSNSSLIPVEARIFASHSPPESPPADIDVLRI